ncbi:hypothetical protein EIP91_008245 [Steccherinum ochraceum]|uniref:Uncharacterized protein n=1 Tax=Steccherinum ochraceum TaxID=92696 RepID=A0A4R0R346_9APHY|nr:hypothetical protein EIP91_008245 [Steccherinum ochraceum]
MPLLYSEHRVLVNGHQQGILCVEISPTGKFVATGGQDGVVCIWAMSSGTVVHRLKGQSRSSVLCLQWSPGRDDRLYFGLADGVVAMGVVDQRLKVDGQLMHQTPIEHLSISPDSKILAVGAQSVLRLTALSLDGQFGESQVLASPPTNSASSSEEVLITSVKWMKSQLVVTYMYHGLA